jgi:hypothetical protein
MNQESSLALLCTHKIDKRVRFVVHVTGDNLHMLKPGKVVNMNIEKFATPEHIDYLRHVHNEEGAWRGVAYVHEEESLCYHFATESGALTIYNWDVEFIRKF